MRPFLVFPLLFLCIMATTRLIAQKNIIHTIPAGWSLNPSAKEDAITGIDTTVKHSGKASAIIKAPRVDYPYYSGLYQNIDATEFRGKRIRISAFLKSDNLLRGWMGASILSVDTTSLAWANTYNKAIEETTDWKRFDILLDVADNARHITFHVISMGDGALWIDDCSISIVEKDGVSSDMSTELTRYKKIAPTKQTPQKPTNLNFEIF